MVNLRSAAHSICFLKHFWYKHPFETDIFSENVQKKIIFYQKNGTMLTKLTQYLLQSDIDLYFSSVYLEQMNLLFLVIGLCIDIQYLFETKNVGFCVNFKCMA